MQRRRLRLAVNHCESRNEMFLCGWIRENSGRHRITHVKNASEFSRIQLLSRHNTRSIKTSSLPALLLQRLEIQVALALAGPALALLFVVPVEAVPFSSVP